jgi:hypothetical protein
MAHEQKALTGLDGQTMSATMLDTYKSNKSLTSHLLGMPLSKYDTPEQICEKIEVIYKLRLLQLENLKVYYEHNIALSRSRVASLPGLTNPPSEG